MYRPTVLFDDKSITLCCSGKLSVRNPLAIGFLNVTWGAGVGGDGGNTST